MDTDLDPADRRLPAQRKSQDLGMVAGVLMIVEVGFFLFGGTCAGLYGGTYVAVAGMTATSGGTSPWEWALIGGFGLVKLVAMLLCLGGSGVMGLGARNLIVGETRLVGVSAAVAIGLPALMLGASILTCSILEAMIWMVPLVLGMVAGAFALQVRPEEVRSEW